MAYSTEERQQIVQTIIDQMGGFGRLETMINAHYFNYFTSIDSPAGLSFHFKGSRKANICQVTLLPSDTYKFELFRFNRRTLDCPMVYELEGIYEDALVRIFEEQTELCLTL